MFSSIWNSQPCSWGLSEYSQGTANFASNYGCSSCCSLRDMMFFVIFSKPWQHPTTASNYRFRNFKLKNTQSEFSENFWKNHKKCQLSKTKSNWAVIFEGKIWNSLSCSWVLSGFSQDLQILPSHMTAQFLLVFVNWRFLCFFSKKFRNSTLSVF